jgi:hypothetical protein
VVPVPHINGTRNPVPVAILQKINSGSHSENQIQFQSGSLFFQIWFWFWFWKSDLIPARFLLTKTELTVLTCQSSRYPPNTGVDMWATSLYDMTFWKIYFRRVSNLNYESLGTPKCVERWGHHVENNIVNAFSRDKRYTCITIGSNTCMQWKIQHIIMQWKISTYPQMCADRHPCSFTYIHFFL